MTKKYTITSEQAQQARKYMKKTKDTKSYRRLEVIALRGEGMKNPEIVRVTGFAEKYVPRIVSLFTHQGFEALLSDQRGGNHRKVSSEQEKEFLASYQKQAEQGTILTVQEMWLDFQETFQVTMKLPAFYRLLHRNHWRKVKPRSRHPKAAGAEEKEASKK